MSKRPVYYYENFTTDVVTSPAQQTTLPVDFDYARAGWAARLRTACLRPAVRLFAWGYQHCGLHLRIKNRRVLRPYRRQGIYLYGNHTQAMGDAFLPFMVLGGQQPLIVASAANWGLPGLRRILAAGGAVPVPTSPTATRHFLQGLRQRLARGQALVIYPEAHVWPYYTAIRPLTAAAFHYPSTLAAPVFTMTVTYQRRRLSVKPRRTVYIDGPFFPDEGLPRRQRQAQLQAQVQAKMTQRSQASTYQYATYQRKAGSA